MARYIFTEEEKHTIVCNFRLSDDIPRQLALALEYAPISAEDPTPKPGRGITEHAVRHELESLRKPDNIYHYIWDFWDPDRWHVAPDATLDAKADELLTRYENLFSPKDMDAEKARRYSTFDTHAETPFGVGERLGISKVW
ncbi:MAG: hypothetical protein Q9221_008899 [Calogaya cf. arnoldii]